MLFPQNLLVKVHGGLEVHIRDFDRGVGDERTCMGNVTHVTSIILTNNIKNNKKQKISTVPEPTEDPTTPQSQKSPLNL